MTTYLMMSDFHGVIEEGLKLLALAGWEVVYNSDRGFEVLSCPENEQIVFCGDATDRGPASDLVLELVMDLHDQGYLNFVEGNHDSKLYRYLKGNKVNIGHGLEMTIEQLKSRGENFTQRVFNFLANIPWKFETEDFVCVHAAYSGEQYNQKHARDLALYGDVSKEKDNDGFPIRLNNWMYKYQGTKPVIFGHIVHRDVSFYNTAKSKAIAIDTGGVFGGMLSAYRWPSGQIYQVKCKEYFTGHKHWREPVYE